LVLLIQVYFGPPFESHDHEFHFFELLLLEVAIAYHFVFRQYFPLSEALLLEVVIGPLLEVVVIPHFKCFAHDFQFLEALLLEFTVDRPFESSDPGFHYFESLLQIVNGPPFKLPDLNFY